MASRSNRKSRARTQQVVERVLKVIRDSQWQRVALSLAVVSEEPPTEFRIFRAGINTTSKGPFLFDDVAAQSVMSAYSKHVIGDEPGVMIDLEHLSVDDNATHYDPDARGWCRLELRGGELWACDVKWTPDGEARLREKRQRFISPTFAADKKTSRVVDLLNIALVANPATDRLMPLVAANKGTSMTRHEKMKALAAKLRNMMKDSGCGDEKMNELAALLSEMEDDDEEAPPSSKAPPAPPKKAKGDDEDKEDEESSKKLSRIEARLDAAEIRELISANRAKFQGSTGPALERVALKMTPKLAREYVEALPETAKAESTKTVEKLSANSGGAPPVETQEVKLSQDEAAWLRGVDPKFVEQVLAHKKVLASKPRRGEVN